MTLVADFNTAVNVPFSRMRQLLLESGGGLQEGVIGATDLKVVQRGAGANMSVDVGAGGAWVQLDTGTRNGLGHAYNDATANVVVTASNATNPRIDQIVLRWNESSIPTGSGNVPTLAVVTGTATSGATLDNRTGAAALPSDCLRLADILVPATSTTVTTANIRDRRAWARGASRVITHPNAADLALSSTTYGAVFTWTVPRLECSGVPLQLSIAVSILGGTVAGIVAAAPATDAVVDTTLARFVFSAAAGDAKVHAETWALAPAAGSHTFDVQMKIGAGNCTLARSNTNGLPQIVLQELVRPNADNT